MTPVGIRDLVRAEHEARASGREASELRQRAEATSSEEERRDFAAEATAREWAMLRSRLAFFFGPGPSTYEVAARLEAWASAEKIGPGVLRALAEALAWKESPGGRS